MFFKLKTILVLIISIFLSLSAFTQDNKKVKLKNTDDIFGPTKKKPKPKSKPKENAPKSPSIYRPVPSPVSKKPTALIKITSDMKGTIWIKNTDISIEVDTFSVKEVSVPTKFSYYFVSEDERFVSEGFEKTIQEHQQKVGLNIELQMKKEYARQQKKEKKATADKKLLSPLTSEMVLIEDGSEEFEISKYEVSIEQFALFVKEDKYNYKTKSRRVRDFTDGGMSDSIKDNIDWQCDPTGRVYNQTEYNLPVVHVSWKDAIAFCEWLNKRDDDYVYRLPIVSEWSLAASGGNSHYKFPWGNDLQKATSYANLINKDGKSIGTIQMTQEDTYVLCSPVGSFQPNEYGLYDMIGNVAEWCQEKVYKGGSYATPLEDASIDKKHAGVKYTDTHPGIGFRVCRVPK